MKTKLLALLLAVTVFMMPTASFADIIEGESIVTLGENLSEQQKEKLEKAKEASPLIGIMHNLKEEFIKIFDESKNLGEGTLKLIDWLKKAEKYYRKSVKTIKRWFGERHCSAKE